MREAQRNLLQSADGSVEGGEEAAQRLPPKAPQMSWDTVRARGFPPMETSQGRADLGRRDDRVGRESRSAGRHREPSVS